MEHRRSEPLTRLTINLPTPQAEHLREEARQTGIPATMIIEAACEQYSIVHELAHDTGFVNIIDADGEAGILVIDAMKYGDYLRSNREVADNLVPELPIA